MKNVLVIGATGDVGQGICGELMKAGWRVIAAGAVAGAEPFNAVLVDDVYRIGRRFWRRFGVNVRRAEQHERGAQQGSQSSSQAWCRAKRHGMGCSSGGVK